MLKSRGGLESDQQVVGKIKCRCSKCVCSSFSRGKTVKKKKKNLFKYTSWKNLSLNIQRICWYNSP